jgi:hypothetical protein
MVTISIDNDTAIFDVQGLDRLWALKSRFEIPLAHIKSARTNPDEVHGWWKGLRMPGTQIPGVITAGTFYHHNRRLFYDMHDPSQTIVIELDNEKYDELIVEVEDPAGAVEMLNEARRNRRMKGEG